MQVHNSFYRKIAGSWRTNIRCGVCDSTQKSFAKAEHSTDMYSCILPVLHLSTSNWCIFLYPSCPASFLSCILPVLLPSTLSGLPPSCPASLLSCLPPVLPPSCPASLLSYLPPVLPPSCPASLLSCLPPVLTPLIKKNWWKMGSERMNKFIETRRHCCFRRCEDVPTCLLSLPLLL